MDIDPPTTPAQEVYKLSLNDHCRHDNNVIYISLLFFFFVLFSVFFFAWCFHAFCNTLKCVWQLDLPTSVRLLDIILQFYKWTE